MRVLFQVRPDHDEQVGGDTVHAVRTAEELRLLGVDADVTGELAPDISGYDVVHLFNTELVEPTFRHTLRARAARVPIVLTPIFWRPPLEDESFALADRATLASRDEVMRHVAFGLADAVTPPSRVELDRIVTRYPVAPPLRSVVPVGVDRAFAEGDGARFSARHEVPLRGFVLCVGRLEERKNQHRLIDACARLGAPLVLIGAVYDDRRGYFDACRDRAAELGHDVRILARASDEEVVDAYAAARVHVLPSLWETIGLTSLEAAAGGCNVVSTSECGVREYLGDEAWYCDPESVDSIRECVVAALAAPLGRSPDVPGRFPWSKAAQLLLPLYEAVVTERAADAGAWRAALTTEQYIEHLEALVQLQLETISLRDDHYAAVRESAERAIEYAQSLEAERGRAEDYARSLEAELEKHRR